MKIPGRPFLGLFLGLSYTHINLSGFDTNGLRRRITNSRKEPYMTQFSSDHLIGTDPATGNRTLLLKKAYFEQTAVMKTLRLFSDRAVCQILPEGEDKVKITFLSAIKPCVDLDAIRHEFYIAVIDQQVREDLLKKTLDVQKTIYAAAFLPTSNVVDWR